MATEYGFTPQQIGEMTLYQIRMFMCDEKDLGSGTIRVGSLAEAAMIKERIDRMHEMIKDWIRGSKAR